MVEWSRHVLYSPALRPVSWRAANRLFLGTFFGLLALLFVIILLVDPYGVVPFSLPIHRAIVSSQRQMYPQILRSGRYDSLLVGTSTSRLLDPQGMDRALGGHFADFAMPSMTAWEQVQIIDFFRRTIAHPKTLIVGLDHEWCDPSATGKPVEQFPTWAYDDNPWNDYLYLLNGVTLESAGRTVGRIFGLFDHKLSHDGYELFVPPEVDYDLARARSHIWGGGPPRPWLPAPPLQLSEAELRAMPLPTLPGLERALSELPPETKIILAFVPVHIVSMPPPGSYGEAYENECKTRIAAIARAHRAFLIDWRIPSPITENDSNFWDGLHYRLPIAYRLIDQLHDAFVEGRESTDGSYRILAR